jgi:hypothetical protein
MTSIPNFGGALSEERMVAIVSRSAAAALAAVVVALVGLFEIDAPGGALGAPVVNAVMLAPPTEAPPNVVRLRRPAPEAVVVSFAADEGEAEWPHLWTYDARGRIVFRTDEQLVRCTNARQRGQEQSDCPDSNDRTPMVSRERSA